MDELETLAIEIVKAVQLCSFFDEISLLMSSSRDSHKSERLLKLNPVLVDGICASVATSATHRWRFPENIPSFYRAIITSLA